jgi:hypothetical protein
MAGITLYDAVAALGITEEWLEESGGELTPELEALLDNANMTFKEKVERVALKVRGLESEAEAIGDEVARLKARAMARENAAKSLKTYLQRCLEQANETKVTGLLCTVAVQLNPPSLQVPESSDLRELFLAGAPGIEIVPESLRVNKRDVLDKVKQYGEGILPADWSVVRTPSLRIR